MYYVDLGGNAEIRIVPDSEVSQMVSKPGFDPGTCGLWAHHDSGVSQMVSEPWFPIPYVVSIRMVIEATGPQSL